MIGNRRVREIDLLTGAGRRRYRLPRGMHFGMRATVTIRDDLFEAADRVAERLGISRSRLYQTALEAYLRRLEEDVLTEQMNAAVERFDHASDEGFRRYIARTWKETMGDDQW